MASKTKIIALLILTLGIVLRIFWLDKSPPSLNWDELAVGYNSYSILETGRDEYGVRLPFVLRSFDDYKPALYSYLSIPFISLLGLTEIGIRAVSVISGMLIIIMSMLIAKHFFQNNRIALFAGLMTSIAPWALLFSRAAFEANLALALLLSGIFLYLASNKNIKILTLSVFLITLSMHTYVAYKLLIPPILLAITYGKRKELTKNPKNFLPPAILIILTILPIIYIHIFHPETAGRFAATSLLAKGGGPIKIIGEIFARYLSYFSPANLFVRGSNEPTQQIPGFGMFYSFEFPFIIVGSLHIIKNFKKYKELIIFILISPLPAALTWNWFYPARALPLFTCFSILSGLGLYILLKKALATKKAIITLSFFFFIAVTISTQLVRFAVTLYMSNQITEQGAWQFGMKELITEVSPHISSYDHVIFETKTAQPYIFTLFYLKFPPEDYQTVGRNVSKPRTGFDFDKFTFRPVLWREDYALRNTLFIAPESSLPEEKVKEIDYVDLYQKVYDRFGNLQGIIVGTR